MPFSSPCLRQFWLLSATHFAAASLAADVFIQGQSCMTAVLDCYWTSLCLTFRNTPTDLLYLRLLQSFPPVCFKDPLDSCIIHSKYKLFRSTAGRSGSLKINARVSHFQTDIVSFSPPNPDHPPHPLCVCVYVPQNIFYCVCVCTACTHTHSVGPVCHWGS